MKRKARAGGRECKDVWEVRTASPAGALRICGEKAEGGAVGSSMHFSLKDPDIGPPYVQEEAPFW